MNLSSFNTKGIDYFRNVIQALRSGDLTDIDVDFLKNPTLLEKEWNIPLEPRRFRDRFELATHVSKKIELAGIHNPMNDNGLWTWLAAALFDSICAKDSSGRYTPKADYRYISSTSYRHFYRHLVQGPVRILRLFQDNLENAQIILCQDPAIPGDFVEQLTSRLDRIMSKAVISVATTLYFDTAKRRPKAGTAPNYKKAGTLRRYLDVLDQLDLTYDLISISPGTLLALLPKEFDVLKSRDSRELEKNELL